MRSDVRLELTSAHVTGSMAALMNAGLVLQKVEYTGPLTVELTIQKRELPRLEQQVQRRGDQIRILSRKGSYWWAQRIWSHPVLLGGILALLLLTVWLPSKVLFVQVEGNQALPTNLILEKASQCGIVFGADRGAVRSEQMKNDLLDLLPQLQWAGINTRGCVAILTVEERSQQEIPQSKGSGHIVARRDGIVTQITAVRGTAVCQVGQAVRAGEVLISGYLDCGGVILDQTAEGEVFGETMREIQIQTAPEQAVRGEMTGSATKFSLILGKNRINFYEDSGILDSTCVKMYEEYYITLPGGFQLPVALVQEQWFYYEMETELVPEDIAAALLCGYAGRYLEEQMIAGQILHRHESVSGYTLDANYICLEMIGQIRYEENTEDYGEIDGKNSQRGAG